MPETEPKPRLIEPVAQGPGQGWKAVLKSGKAAVVHELPIPPAEAAAAAPRLQRLFERPHPALSPILAWGTDTTGVWVAVEPNEGTPLGTILARGALKAPAAAALGAAVLSGVAALHEAGIAMGGFGASNVRVTGNGVVRLAGYPAAALRGAPTQNDLRADVRSSGMAVCAAFGVDPAGAPAPPTIPPGLVVTIRSMASGAMGPAADRAQGALREMASALLAPDRQAAAETELALRSGGREVPLVTPFLTQTPAEDDETPIRRPAPYDAPERAVETYPALATPDYAQPTAGLPPATAAPAPSAPGPGPKPAPTWEEVQPPTPSPTPPAAQPAPAPGPSATNLPPPSAYPPAAAPPATPVTGLPPASPNPYPQAPQPAQPAPGNPPPPSPYPPAQAPAAAWDSPVAPPVPRDDRPKVPAPTWDDEPAAPSGSASEAAAGLRWDARPGAPATGQPRGTRPPTPTPPVEVPPAAPAPPVEPAPAAAAAPAPQPVAPASREQTWTPIVAPAWPGADLLAEEAAEAAARAAAAAPAPAPTPVGTNPPLSEPIAPARRSAPPPVRRPTVPPGEPVGFFSDRPAWLVPAAVAVVVVIVLASVGAVLLGRHGSSSTATRSPSPTATSSAKASPSPATKGLLDLPAALAQSNAAPVTSVQICTPASPCNYFGGSDTDSVCDLTTSCKVDVAVYMTSLQSAPIAYTFKFFDRCTGQTTDLPGPAAGSSTFYKPAITHPAWPLSLPSGAKAGALVAITSSPGAAISAPVLLGATSCS
jgi:hypothetical protein